MTDVVGGDDGHAARDSEVGQTSREALPVALEVTVHVGGRGGPEDSLETIEAMRRRDIHERSLLTAGEAMQSCGMLLDLLPRGQGVALRTPRDGGREETAEIAIAGAVLDQQPERSRAGDRDLRADQCAHPGAPRRREETRRARDAGAGAARGGVVTQRRRALDQILGQRGAAQEAEGAATAKLDVVRGGGHDRIFVFSSPSLRSGQEGTVPSPRPTPSANVAGVDAAQVE